MYRYALAAAMLAALSPWVPSHAVTSQDKMATCKFGADDQHLQGKARSAFMKKCMSDKDEPRRARRRPARRKPSTSAKRAIDPRQSHRHQKADCSTGGSLQ